MAISVFDLFKIGIGPSSSHTVGPMRAARLFAQGLEAAGELEAVVTVKAELFGSLGATGVGHGSDKAVILGLEGEEPETVDTDAIPGRMRQVREERRLRLLGRREIPFKQGEHLVLHRRKSLPYHPNGMRFTAFAADGRELRAAAYYSVGGGFVVDEAAAGADRINKPDDTALPYPFLSAEELLRLCAAHGLSISALMLENEQAWHTKAEIRERLLAIWQVMQDCVRQSCRSQGVLPGGSGSAAARPSSTASSAPPARRACATP